VRGRPKHNPRRRAPRNCSGRRDAELSLRVADGPKNWLGNTVWRIKRRPVWNIVWRRWAACRSLLAVFAAPKRSPEIRDGPLRVRLWPYRRSKPSLRRECLGSDATRAWNRPSLRPRGSRWLWEGRKNAGIVQKRSVPALHREAERDTTGSNSRQHPVHTWIGRRVQGKRRGPATLILIHKMPTEMPLRSR
jgi:hypothetical protein